MATDDFTSAAPPTSDAGVTDAVGAAESALQVLRTLHVAAASITQLLDSSLDVERIDSDKFALDARPCNVRRVFTDAVQQLRIRAAAQHVTLRLDVSALPPLPRVVADRFRLLQAVTNLGTNAIKFVDHGGSGVVTIRVSIDRQPVTAPLAKPPAHAAAVAGGPPELATLSVQTGSGSQKEAAAGSVAAVAASSREAPVSAAGIGSVMIAVHGQEGIRSSPLAEEADRTTSSAAGAAVHLRSNESGALHTRRRAVEAREVLIGDREDASPADSFPAWLVVDVIDNGVGMSPDNLAKLFTPFTQFNAGKLQQGKGSGLGEWGWWGAVWRANTSACSSVLCVRVQG